MGCVMKSIHLEKAKSLPSFHAARHFSLQLFDYAKNLGKDIRGIKLLDKKACRDNKIHADCAIVWEEGPQGWVFNIAICQLPNVDIRIQNENTITFYDIPYRVKKGN